MKKLKAILAFALVLVMMAALLAGCATDKKPVETDPGSSESTPAGTGGLDDISKHEIYTMENRIPLSTVVPPILNDRSAIDKALPSETKESVRIGYVTWTTGTPFFAALLDTIQSEAANYGYEVSVAVSDSSIEKHIAAIETFISMGVDIIIDNSMDVVAQSPVIRDAVSAGIPVIGLGLAFPEDVPLITTIGVNYYNQGFLTGQWYAQQTEGEYVKAAAMPGSIGHTIAESKLNGFLGGFLYERYQQIGEPFATIEDAMLAGTKLEQEIVNSSKCKDEKAQLEIATSINGFWSAEGGLKAAEDILTAHPDISLIFSDNDQQGFGAIKAIEQAGLTPGVDVNIISIGDGTKECMEMIQSGEYLASTVASPYTQSKACVDLVYKIFGEGFDASNLPNEIDLEDILLTKDNVSEYYDADWAFGFLTDPVFMSITEINQKAAA